jgi:hypothetical protein
MSALIDTEELKLWKPGADYVELHGNTPELHGFGPLKVDKRRITCTPESMSVLGPLLGAVDFFPLSTRPCSCSRTPRVMHAHTEQSVVAASSAPRGECTIPPGNCITSMRLDSRLE